MAWQRLSHILVIVSLTLIAAGCGSDESSGESGDDCPLGEQENAITGECELQDDHLLDAGDDDSGSTGVDSGNDAATPDDSGPDDAGPGDAGPGDTGPGDTGPGDSGDAGQEVGDDADPACPDRDGDGVTDHDCGGLDCDDTNPQVAPGMPEVCDAHDNDCDGNLNQGLECSFYAHSINDMYLVDPFAKTATQVTTVPSLFDLDTHPDGTLYGISSSSLYKYEGPGNWTHIGSLGVTGTPNGLAIDNQGTAYLTASNSVYTVDLATGAATTIGSMGGSYNSSGDCVVNKDNSLYMSSNHNAGGDNLVIIDGTTGQAQDVGAIGEASVYGLTAAWGRMFGLTGNGKLIEINSGTGQGTVLHTFPNISWYGAASTPQR